MESKVRCGQWGMFLLRVVLGAIFVAHGWGKLQGMEDTIMFFASLGFGSLLAYLVAWTELLAGLAMILGLFTRIAGYLIAAVMVVAMFSFKFKTGFMGGFELDLILLASALAVAWNGGGALSMSKKGCGCGKCAMCGGSMTAKDSKCDNCQECKNGCTGHEKVDKEA